MVAAGWSERRLRTGSDRNPPRAHRGRLRRRGLGGARRWGRGRARPAAEAGAASLSVDIWRRCHPGALGILGQRLELGLSDLDGVARLRCCGRRDAPAVDYCAVCRSQVLDDEAAVGGTAEASVATRELLIAAQASRRLSLARPRINSPLRAIVSPAFAPEVTCATACQPWRTPIPQVRRNGRVPKCPTHWYPAEFPRWTYSATVGADPTGNNPERECPLERRLTPISKMK